jgi:flagellum-specific ATP synthase
MRNLRELAREIEAMDLIVREGRVVGVRGLLIEITGPVEALAIGARVEIDAGGIVRAEIVGFREDCALVLPLDPMGAMRPGARVRFCPADAGVIWPSRAWLGRVVDAFGAAVDGKGAMVRGRTPRPVRAPPPPAQARARLGPRLDLGVRALNAFAGCRRGQRMGIFAGSGVGKSVLLSMLARFAAADVIVIGMIGERGREVREFIEDTLGPEGLARAVVVVATSDEPAARRRLAAETAAAVAEHFRDEGRDVLLLMDSVTRFAMAAREIGLAAGEPPTAKGYTPSVFAELPRLLERAGPGLPGPDGRAGSITALFTVLVDGDDHNEPIADAVRGVLDGHIVMERKIAERGRYPAVDVLKSISRTMPGVHEPQEMALVTRARRILSALAEMEDLVRLGAYKPGSDPDLDEALRVRGSLEAFLGQAPDDCARLPATFAALEAALA